MTWQKGYRTDNQLDLPTDDSKDKYFDVAALFSTIDFDGATAGLASVGAACNLDSGASVNEIRGGIFHAAVIFAHELGHNLNMKHDDAPGRTGCDL
eukprot:UC1_evm1s1542